MRKIHLFATSVVSFSVFIVLSILVLVSTSTSVFASSNSNNPSNYTEKKIDKMAKKEARKYKKEGWKVKPGALPLQLQLSKSYTMLYTSDANSSSSYFSGEASAQGEFYDAALLSANELARLNLAANMISFIQGGTQITGGNDEAAERTTSVLRTIVNSKNIIAAALRQQIIPVTVYRELGDRIEVRVIIYYNKSTALQTAKQAVRESLIEESKEFGEELDRIFDNLSQSGADTAVSDTTSVQK